MEACQLHEPETSNDDREREREGVEIYSRDIAQSIQQPEENSFVNSLDRNKASGCKRNIIENEIGIYNKAKVMKYILEEELKWATSELNL